MANWSIFHQKIRQSWNYRKMHVPIRPKLKKYTFKCHSGIDHVNIFWESQRALWAFSRHETTTANSDPNKLWKQPVSDYSLSTQNDINHSGLTERCQATHWSQFGQKIVKLSTKCKCVKQILGWMESLSVTLKYTMWTYSGKTNGRFESFHNRELPLLTQIQTNYGSN